MANVGELLEARLSAEKLGAVRAVAAARLRLPLYLVGGTVRDILLSTAVSDLDLTVVGDGPDAVDRLAQRLDGRVLARSQFGTMKVDVAGTVIDLALARIESYSRPGALPEVTAGGIEQDLTRRDFSINAMAVSLGDRFGEIIDPFCGHSDLGARLIRVLHPRSFVDDATRLLRAARYAARLGFELEAPTAELFQSGLRYMEAVSGDRVRNELERCFTERDAGRALLMAQKLGVLRAVHPGLALTEEAGSALWDPAIDTLSPRSLVLLALLAYPASDAQGVCRRLNLSGRRAEAVIGVPRVKTVCGDLEREPMPPSRIVEILQPLDDAAIEACMLAMGGDSVAGERMGRYLTELRHVRPELNGSDLMGLGVPEGPRVGEMLTELRRARLDGLLSTAEDEERYVRRTAGGFRACGPR